MIRFLRSSDPAPPLDPEGDAFAYGWGVFETIRVATGGLRYFHAHMERMERSADALGIPRPASRDAIARHALDGLRREGVREGVLKIFLLKNGEAPLCLIRLRSGAPSGAGETAAPRLATHPAPRDARAPTAGHKTTNYMDLVALKRRARDRGYDDFLLLAPGERVVETVFANVFALIDGRLLTPPAAELPILPGVIRSRVLALAGDAGLPASERDLTVEELAGADALLTTNAATGIVPAARLELPDGRAFAFGTDDPRIAALRETLDRDARTWLVA